MNESVIKVIDGIKHCEKRLPLKFSVVFKKEVLLHSNGKRLRRPEAFFQASESTHICATRLLFSFIILLQHRWPIESKLSQTWYFMHMLGYTNIYKCVTIPLRKLTLTLFIHLYKTITALRKINTINAGMTINLTWNLNLQIPCIAKARSLLKTG